MSLEIHQPEIEALIQQRMASGAFHDVEDLLLHALKCAPIPEAASAQPRAHRKSLEEIFAKVRGLAEDLDFGRDRSPGRAVDLS